MQLRKALVTVTVSCLLICSWSVDVVGLPLLVREGARNFTEQNLVSSPPSQVLRRGFANAVKSAAQSVYECCGQPLGKSGLHSMAHDGRGSPYNRLWSSPSASPGRSSHHGGTSPRPSGFEMTPPRPVKMGSSEHAYSPLDAQKSAAARKGKAPAPPSPPSSDSDRRSLQEFDIVRRHGGGHMPPNRYGPPPRQTWKQTAEKAKNTFSLNNFSKTALDQTKSHHASTARKDTHDRLGSMSVPTSGGAVGKFVAYMGEGSRVRKKAEDWEKQKAMKAALNNPDPSRGSSAAGEHGRLSTASASTVGSYHTAFTSTPRPSTSASRPTSARPSISNSRPTSARPSVSSDSASVGTSKLEPSNGPNGKYLSPGAGPSGVKKHRR